MAGFRIEGFTQTTELQGGNKVVPVREYRVIELPHEVYFQFRRPKAKWAPATIKSVAQQFADRIEGVLGLPNVVDVAYSQDVTPSGQLQDRMTTFYSTEDDEIQGSVEQRLADFGPNKTGALVAGEVAAGGDFLGPVILAAAPAVPLVGIPVLLTLAFVTFVAAMLAWGMIKLFDYTLGLLLDEVSDLVDSLPFVGGFAADKLRRVKNRMRARLADAAMALDTATARFFQGAQMLVELTADVLYEFGGDVYDAYRALVEVVIPGTIAAGTAPIDQRLDRVNKREDARARAEAQARARGIDAVQRDLLMEKLAREHGIDAVITRVTARIRAAEGTFADAIGEVWGYTRRTINRRIGRLEQLAFAGALTAVAVRALDLRFPFWKCSNVRNFNRFLCRMPVGLLDALLGIGIPILVLSDICRMAAIIRTGAEAFAPVLSDLVAVAGAATNCTSLPPAPALPLAAAALPASSMQLVP